MAVFLLLGKRKTEKDRQATKRKRMSVLNNSPETSKNHRSRKKQVFVLEVFITIKLIALI